MAYAGFLRALPTPTATHTGFVCLLSAGWFTQANANALDGTTFINGGGSLRIYTDATKTTRLPLEVVEFVTGGSPSVIVWVRIPTYSAGQTVWVESDSVATVQPPVTDTYGRNAVWVDYARCYHLDSTIDSAGNGNNLTAVGSPSVTQVAVGDGYSFAGAGDYVYDNSTLPQSAGNVYSQSFIYKHTEPLENAIIAVSGIADSASPFGNFAITLGFAATPNRVYVGAFARDISSVNDWSNVAIDGVSNGDLIFISANHSSSDTELIVVHQGNVYTGLTDRRITTGTRDRFSLNRLMDSSPNDGGSVICDEHTLTNSGYIKTIPQIQDEYANQSNPDNFGTSSGWTTGVSGALIIPAPTASGSLTKVAPSFSVNGSVTIAKPVVSGNISKTAPQFNSSLAVTIPSPLVSGSISKTIPQFNASGSLTIPAPLVSGSLSNGVSVINASGNVTISKPQLSGALDKTAPQFSASGSVLIPSPLISGNISSSLPFVDASGSITIGKPTASGTLDKTKPVYTASGSITIQKPLINGDLFNGVINVTFNTKTNYNQVYLSSNFSQPFKSTNRTQ